MKKVIIKAPAQMSIITLDQINMHKVYAVKTFKKIHLIVQSAMGKWTILFLDDICVYPYISSSQDDESPRALLEEKIGLGYDVYEFENIREFMEEYLKD